MLDAVLLNGYIPRNNLFSIKGERDLELTKENHSLFKANARQRAWVEVNPSTIENNARNLRPILSNGCLLMAVVKADGYGHGAETVSRAALDGGANSLGVATLQEGIELRNAGLDCPILVLGNLIDSAELLACLHWDLMLTLSSEREALLCQNLADGTGRHFSVHLKFDTGMARLGCHLEDAPKLIEKIDQLSNLELKGIYSHLALAEEESYCELGSVTFHQKERFESVVRNISISTKNCCFHLANSAGTLRDSGLHYDMVRVGLALYGYNPLKYSSAEVDLKPALSVKARVTLIREVASGVGVSYGHAFITTRLTRLAVVSIGYADGISQNLSGKISVLFNGFRLPQVGAITMDQLLIDITDHPEVRVGSVVTLLGKDGNDCITLQEWCDLNSSILWEVLCGFNQRLPRLLI